MAAVLGVCLFTSILEVLKQPLNRQVPAVLSDLLHVRVWPVVLSTHKIFLRNTGSSLTAAVNILDDTQHVKHLAQTSPPFYFYELKTLPVSPSPHSTVLSGQNMTASGQLQAPDDGEPIVDPFWIPWARTQTSIRPPVLRSETKKS